MARSRRRSAKQSTKRSRRRSRRRSARPSRRRSRRRSARPSRQRSTRPSRRRSRQRSTRPSRRRSRRRSRGGVKKKPYRELTRGQNMTVHQLSQLPLPREHLSMILDRSQPNRGSIIPTRREARADYDAQERRVLWLLNKSPEWYIADQISYILYDMNEYRKTITERTTKMEYARQLRDLLGIVHFTYPRLRPRLPHEINDEW
jgi:hypothetical protein